MKLSVYRKAMIKAGDVKDSCLGVHGIAAEIQGFKFAPC